MKAKRKGQNILGFTDGTDVYEIRPRGRRDGIDLISDRFRERSGTARPRFIVSSISESDLLDALPLTWRSCSRTHRLSPRQFATLLESDKPNVDHHPNKESLC